MQENKFISASSLKTMVSVIEDLRIAIMELHNRVEDQDNKFELLRAELERQILVDDRMSKEIRKCKQEIESIKAGDIKAGDAKSGDAKADGEKATAKDTDKKSAGKTMKFNTPIMNGSGFSHITAGYLKSLGKR